jgi:hypothetical protein
MSCVSEEKKHSWQHQGYGTVRHQSMVLYAIENAKNLYTNVQLLKEGGLP